MKLNGLVIALALLTAFVSDSKGQSQEQLPSARETSQPQEQKPAANDKTAQSDQKKVESPPIIVNVLPTPKSDHEAEDERQERKEKAELDRRLVSLTADLALFTAGLFAATAALVIATIALAYYAFKQSRDMKASLRLADKAAEAADRSARAAIGLQLPVFRAKPASLGHGQSIVSGVKREDCWVHFVEFSNHGSTKAFPVEVHYGVIVGNKSLPKEPNYTDVEFFEVNATYEPDSDKPYIVYLPQAAGELKNDQWSDICQGKLGVTFHCLLAYLDFMDTRREIGFCWRWEKRGMGMDWVPDGTPAYNRKA